MPVASRQRRPHWQSRNSPVGTAYGVRVPKPSVSPADWPSDLDAAIEELLDAFERRPKPANPLMCVGHCTDQADYEELCRISPRDLDGDLLDHYRSNTSFDWELMTHFMPALLRAMPTDDGISDLTVTIGLLARWPELTERERAAVDTFCRAWLADTLSRWPTRGHTASRVLEATAQIGLDIVPYLAYWETVDTDEARWQLVDTVVDDPEPLFAATFDRWLLTPAARAMIAECGRSELTNRDRERLDVVAWAIGVREQGRW
jgi:hypothetical protein